MQEKPCRAWFQDYPLSGRVLEVGSRNVNGTVRAFVPVTVGIDLVAGKGVDRVLDAVELPRHYPAGSFDAVVSVDALEHCADWKGAVLGMWWCLKNGGTLALSAAMPGKGRHDWPGDYWRFTGEDFRRIFSAQNIRDVRKLGCSTAVTVEKVTDDLGLDFEVKAVG